MSINYCAILFFPAKRILVSSVNIIRICMNRTISVVGGGIIYSNKTRNTFFRNVNKLEDISHS
jgi:hypothetical protein